MYPEYPHLPDELDRQRDLERYGVLNSPGDDHFDRLVRLAATVLETPIALISLVDDNRQWFLARHGIEATETPRQMAFCAHAIATTEPLVVNDARNDPRFCNNPLVLNDPKIRFYAGAQLASSDGHNLGTLCIIDRLPRNFSSGQVKLLQDLAQLVVRELDLRRQMVLCPLTGLANRNSFMELGQREINRAVESGKPMALLLLEIDQFNRINNMFGHEAGDQLLRDVADICKDQQRPQDLFGHIRDDQFAILMVDTDQDAALERGDAIRCAISELQSGSGNSQLHPRVHGGLTELAISDATMEDLLTRAGQALLAGQSSGQGDQISRLVSEPEINPSTCAPASNDGIATDAASAARRHDDRHSSRKGDDPGR